MSRCKILRNRKNRIARRLKAQFWPEQPSPMFAGSNIHYEMSDKVQAVACGRLGAIHLMARKIGLVDAIDEKVTVLKRHLPYHESDHVLNLAYNILAGGIVSLSPGFSLSATPDVKTIFSVEELSSKKFSEGLLVHYLYFGHRAYSPV